MKEIWKQIEENTNYYVSNTGRVKSGFRKELIPAKKYKIGYSKKSYVRNRYPRILKNIKSNTGYCVVGIPFNGKIKQFFVHRLVAKYFIENTFKKPQVNHKDGNGNNNNVNNLEWCTASENGVHAYKVLGVVPYTKGRFGVKSPKARAVEQRTLDDKLVRKWDCASDAVRECGFDSGSITHVCKGESKMHKGFKWNYV
jgi:hypothetical protein